MSGWDAYITTLIESNDGIRRAAIVGAADGAVWAKSQGGDREFRATDAELSNLVKAFGDITSIPTTGTDLEGVHYVVPRAEDNVIFGKKGKQGIVAMKTSSALLVAVFEGEAAAGSACRTAVEKLGNYLIESGY
ncbi:Profilin [Aphelenchoides bicaudatus]|nr:Profilin [Aphelenchoides bicaudatus]